MRWGIFVHEPDGDMGDGRIVGPFAEPERADARADLIRRRAEAAGRYVECIVLPLMAGGTSAREVVGAVGT